MAWWAHVTKCGWEKTRSSSRQDLRSRNAVTCFNTSGQVKTQIQRYQQHIQFLYAVCETFWSLQLVYIWMRYLTYDTFFEKTALVYICAVVYSIHGLTGSHVKQLVLRCACRRNDTLLPVAMTRTRQEVKQNQVPFVTRFCAHVTTNGWLHISNKPTLFAHFCER